MWLYAVQFQVFGKTLLLNQVQIPDLFFGQWERSPRSRKNMNSLRISCCLAVRPGSPCTPTIHTKQLCSQLVISHSAVSLATAPSNLEPTPPSCIIAIAIIIIIIIIIVVIIIMGIKTLPLERAPPQEIHRNRNTAFVRASQVTKGIESIRSTF